MNVVSRPSVLPLVVASTLSLCGGCASSEGSGGSYPSGGYSVPAAVATNPRYTPDALKEAFAVVCGRLGHRLLRVEVDESQFPPLVYGVIEGYCDYNDIRDTLKEMPGYDYSACVTLGRPGGSRTVFALSIIPQSAMPQDPAARQEIMERAKVLARSQM